MKRSNFSAWFGLSTLFALILIHYLVGYFVIHQILGTLNIPSEGLPLTHKDYFNYSFLFGGYGIGSLLIGVGAFLLPSYLTRKDLLLRFWPGVLIAYIIAVLIFSYFAVQRFVNAPDENIMISTNKNPS